MCLYRDTSHTYRVLLRHFVLCHLIQDGINKLYLLVLLSLVMWLFHVSLTSCATCLGTKNPLNGGNAGIM